MAHVLSTVDSIVSTVDSIVIDIETIPNLEMTDFMPTPKAPKNYKDPDKIAAYVQDKEQEQVAGMALDIDFAKISAVGLAFGIEGDPISYLVRDVLDEMEILEFVWTLISNTRGPVIGWNVRGFDLPILKRRAWVLDVPVNIGFEISRYSKDIVDLMQLLYHEGYGPGPRARSLKVVYPMYVGENPLPELDGSQVDDMGDETLRAYVENDVVMTQQLAQITEGWYW